MNALRSPISTVAVSVAAAVEPIPYQAGLHLVVFALVATWLLSAADQGVSPRISSRKSTVK
jgi:hypothetical protein